MLYCGALERSNNPYTEQIVEPCVSKNQRKRWSSLYGSDWEKNPEKGLRQCKKVSWAESGICVFVCMREKK